MNRLLFSLLVDVQQSSLIISEKHNKLEINLWKSVYWMPDFFFYLDVTGVRRIIVLWVGNVIDPPVVVANIYLGCICLNFCHTDWLQPLWSWWHSLLWHSSQSSDAVPLVKLWALNLQKVWSFSLTSKHFCKAILDHCSHSLPPGKSTVN